MSKNANTPAPDVASESILTRIRAQYPGKPPTKEQSARLVKDLKDAQAKVAAAEAALEAAKEVMYRASFEIVKATGAQPLSIDGQLYEPASRGDKVFLRAKTGTVVEL
jgi:hypothetical protein